MTTDAVGGVWTYALELVRALAPHGVEVTLASMGPLPTPEQRREAHSLGNLQLHARPYRLEWMHDPWEAATAAGDWLLELQHETSPHVVHLNGYVHGALPWRAPVVMVGHSCVLSWWDSVKGQAAPGEWSRYRQEVTRGLRSADCVVAPTVAMLAYLRQFYAPGGELRVIHNGRAPLPFSAREKEPLVFSAGRLWDEAKNIGALESAAPGLSWPVCVAGDNQHPDGGETVCESLRLLGKLSPAGMAEWLSRASIYALPARYEPFGLSALEAAQAGCALVLGDIPSLREVWDDAALYVAPEDPDALRFTLETLIRDRALTAELGRRARARAARYTPEAMARGYVEIYDRLLQASVETVLHGEALESPPRMSGHKLTGGTRI